MLKEEQLTRQIIAAFYAVYDELGYGFLEAVYSSSIAEEFKRRSIPFQREASVTVYYKGLPVGFYRADFIVAERVAIELKATESINEADKRQLLNYVRSTRLELGILLHFGPKPAFKRVIFENARKRSLPEAS